MIHVTFQVNMAAASQSARAKSLFPCDVSAVLAAVLVSLPATPSDQHILRFLQEVRIYCAFSFEA
ncbi:hypothetical protein, partial [Metallibacterium scheffleri]|uniref:hypothetical protein n=1 Tax=Metallibacterium scheffleri TaxID=993689 RepID=UPI0023F08862